MLSAYCCRRRHRNNTNISTAYSFSNQTNNCPPFCILLLVFCFSVIFACVCFTSNVIINVTSIGRRISELMFLWWPAILYSVLNSVCLLMANKWMMMMMMKRLKYMYMQVSFSFSRWVCLSVCLCVCPAKNCTRKWCNGVLWKRLHFGDVISGPLT